MSKRVKKRKQHRWIVFFVFLLLSIGIIASLMLAKTSQDLRQRAAEPSFRNPIANSGADPWIIFKDGYYYYTHTTGGTIHVWRSKAIQDVTKEKAAAVWSPPRSGNLCCNIWAPELHFINDKWYIYFAADDGHDKNHRMYVLESISSDPQGDYILKGKISDPSNRWAIDGTVLQKPDGSLYLVWSGWEGNAPGPQNLYIAPMSNPWTISGDRVNISSPTYEWEKHGGPVNEGPQVLQNNGKIFIVYSASGSWTDDYGMGMLTNIDGNVLNPASWIKNAQPVFSKTDTVFGPGHGSFVKSPDGKEDWMLYHAAKAKGSGWNRNVRAQKFTWNDDGTPNFGHPVPLYSTKVNNPTFEITPTLYCIGFGPISCGESDQQPTPLPQEPMPIPIQSRTTAPTPAPTPGNFWDRFINFLGPLKL